MKSSSITDGFHLVVDALKLNGIDTIFGVAGIPITDLLVSRKRKGCDTSAFATNNPPEMRPRSRAI